MTKQTKKFMELLESLNIEAAEYLLQDLRNPEKRNPQLYNAIRQLLAGNKFSVASVEQPKDETMAELLSELPELTEDEIATGYHLN